MHRFSNSLRPTRRLPHNAAPRDHREAQEPAASSGAHGPQISALRAHLGRLSSSVLPALSIISNNLQHVQTYVHVIGTRVQYLQGLLENERSCLMQVTEIKRKLKALHRDLEKFQLEAYEPLGEEIEVAVSHATRRVWQSYRNMVGLEERLRAQGGVEGSGSLREENSGNNERIIALRDGGQDNERQGVYIPTGARVRPTGGRTLKRRSQRLLHFARSTEEQAETEETLYAMSGALPVEQGPEGSIRQAGRKTTDMLRSSLSRVLARVAHSPSISVRSCQWTNPEEIPQPRDSVKLRIRQEEANRSFALKAPDTARRGSCNGFTITDMTMCGIEDHCFVLPFFHHIKHHEVRALKDWLVQRNYVERSGPISRMEKVLHCIQLLQTGCRYESLAVIFSRTPRQIKESCHEVMRGLSYLHAETARENELSEQIAQEYMDLWGLWNKYNLSKGRAVVYYGFRSKEVAQVLQALNLYIGRWRMQGGFKTEGPAFNWGRVFIVDEASQQRGNELQREVHDIKTHSRFYQLDPYAHQCIDFPGTNGKCCELAKNEAKIHVILQDLVQKTSHGETASAMSWGVSNLPIQHSTTSSYASGPARPLFADETGQYYKLGNGAKIYWFAPDWMYYNSESRQWVRYASGS